MNTILAPRMGVIKVAPKVPYAGHRLVGSLTVRTTSVKIKSPGEAFMIRKYVEQLEGDVRFLTPETHMACVRRFMAKKIYGREAGDPFAPTGRLLKPRFKWLRRNTRIRSVREPRNQRDRGQVDVLCRTYLLSNKTRKPRDRC